MFDVLKGKCTLTGERQIALQKVEEAISQQQTRYTDYDQLLAVWVTATHVPTAILWQGDH